MLRCVVCVVLVGSMFAAAFAGAPSEAEVQGLYEGVVKDGTGEHKIEVRVVAQGQGTFKVFVRRDLGEGKVAKVDLEGKTEGEAVSLKGKAGDDAWTGSCAAGAIKGTCGDIGSFEAKRVTRKPPTLGKKAPEGALVLLDGKDFKEMVRGNGQPWYLGDASKEGWAVWEVAIRTVAKQPAAWPSKETPLPEGWELQPEHRQVDVVLVVGEDGSIQVPRGGMNSRQQVEGSFDLHVEFLCPFVPTAHSQGRGNSGVYLPNGQEIQVLDSFGDSTYKGGGCGGLYGKKDPDAFDVFSLASLPPLEWQAYDIEYRVQRKDGKIVGKPLLTVVHNGIKIHDKVELGGDARKGGFHFQDHGNPVRYRNIWVLPLADKAGEL